MSNEPVSFAPYILDYEGETYFTGDILLPPYSVDVFNHLWFHLIKNDWIKKNTHQKYGVINGLDLEQDSDGSPLINIKSGRFVAGELVYELLPNLTFGSDINNQIRLNEDGWYLFWADYKINPDTGNGVVSTHAQHFTNESVFDAGDTLFKRQTLANGELGSALVGDKNVFLGFAVAYQGTYKLKSFHNKGTSLGILRYDGTETNPALKFQNAIQTGIYTDKPSGEYRGLHITTEGKTAFTVRGNQTEGKVFVGIGTTLPKHTLQVVGEDVAFTNGGNEDTGLFFYPLAPNGTTGSGGRIFFKENSTDQEGFSIGYNGGLDNQILNWPEKSFVFSKHSGSSTGSIEMIIRDSKVGIGTDNPQSKLHVVGDDVAITNHGTQDKGVFIIPDNYAGGGGRIFFKQTEDSRQGFSIGYNGDSPALSGEILGSSPNTFAIAAHKNDTQGFVALSITRDQGFVGIGTDTPLAPLHFYRDEVFFSDGSNANKEGISILPYSSESGPNRAGGRIFFAKDQLNNEGFSLGYQGDYDGAILNWPSETFVISRHTGGASGNTGEVAFSIRRDLGFVGIGTDTARARLHVMNGALAISEDDGGAGSQESGLKLEAFYDPAGTSSIIRFKGTDDDQGEGFSMGYRGGKADESRLLWPTTNTSEKTFEIHRHTGGATAETASLAIQLDTGNIGINTQSPKTSFHAVVEDFSLTNGGNEDTGIFITPTEDGTGKGGGRVFFKQTSDGQNGFTLGYNGGADPLASSMNWEPNTFYISSHDGSSSGEVALSIRQTGGHFVGINTNVPRAQFHVVGEAAAFTNPPQVAPTADELNEGIFIKPFSKDNESGGRIQFVQNATFQTGFSLGSHGSSSGTIMSDWEPNHFYISRSYTDGFGITHEVALSISQSNGFVGIGTNQPRSRLHVNGGELSVTAGGNHDAGLFLVPLEADPLGEKSGGRIYFKERDLPGSSNGFSMGYNGGSTTGGALLDWPEDTFVIARHFNTPENESIAALSIKRSNGYIGIGTDTPLSPFHIVVPSAVTSGIAVLGEPSVSITSDTNLDTGIFLVPHSDPSAPPGAPSGGRIQFNALNTGDNAVALGYYGTGDNTFSWPQDTFVIAAFNENTSTNGKIILSVANSGDNAGYVGIGTDQPQSDLHIVGDQAAFTHPDGGNQVGIFVIPDKGSLNNSKGGGQIFFKENHPQEEGFSIGYKGDDLPDDRTPQTFEIQSHYSNETTTHFSINKTTGFVGIGTSKAKVSFHVVGDKSLFQNTPNANDEGIYILPSSNDNSGTGGGKIFFKEDAGDAGFSLGYNDVSSTFPDVADSNILANKILHISTPNKLGWRGCFKYRPKYRFYRHRNSFSRNSIPCLQWGFIGYWRRSFARSIFQTK